MKLDECVSFRLARVSRALYRPYVDRLRRYHMTPPQLFLMMSLYERDDVAAGELAARVYLDKSTLTGILGRLENYGYITRTSDENDGRSVRVTLTEKGRKLRRPLTTIYDDVNRRVLEALGLHAASALALLAVMEQAADSVSG